MPEKSVMFLTQKESFVSRVLVKKIVDSGTDCRVVPLTVDDINLNAKEASLVVLFVDEGETPKDSVIRFLIDTMETESLKMIVVADEFEIKKLVDRLPGDLIYKVFSRPVDNTEFINAVNQCLTVQEEGGFRKSILIVDDDPQYLTLVREWLRGHYKVAMANSGLQAIKWLGKNTVDLILLDHEMPVTSGPQVLEMLRSDPETRSIPVMFLTGKGDKESVMAVVALKPEGYFLKGIKKEELLEKLQEYFWLHKND